MMTDERGSPLGTPLPPEEAKKLCSRMQARFRVPGEGYPTWTSLREPIRVSPVVLCCRFVCDQREILLLAEGRKPSVRVMTPRDLSVFFRRRGPWSGPCYAVPTDLEWCVAFCGEDDRGREAILLSGAAPEPDCKQAPPAPGDLLRLEDRAHTILGDVIVGHQDDRGDWWNEFRPSAAFPGHPVLPLLENPRTDPCETREYGLRLVQPRDEEVLPWFPENPRLKGQGEFVCLFRSDAIVE